MAVNRRRGRRTAVLATAASAFALSAGLLTGCEFDDSVDCLSNADAITDSITAINRAGADAVEDPTRTADSIDTIEKNLNKIDAGGDGGSSDGSEVDKAVRRLQQAVEDYNQDVLDGERPDSTEIDKAASALRDVCAP